MPAPRTSTSLLITLAACLFACIAPARARAQDACRGVACSGHGSCLEERGRALCLCEDGYAAIGASCARVRVPASILSNRDRPSVRRRIVEIATAQRGHDARLVCSDLDVYPYGLGRYVRRGEWWCTDFVSWVYRAAGVPFTGGYQGGWMIKNNFLIKRWYERHGLWVAKGSAEWEGYEPRPGDYMRIHTDGGGHSAIVHHVDGDTLYTVEGNVGNRVRLRTWRQYRRHPRIDGFGLLSARRTDASARR